MFRADDAAVLRRCLMLAAALRYDTCRVIYAARHYLLPPCFSQYSATILFAAIGRATMLYAPMLAPLMFTLRARHEQIRMNDNEI